MARKLGRARRQAAVEMEAAYVLAMWEATDLDDTEEVQTLFAVAKNVVKGTRSIDDYFLDWADMTWCEASATQKAGWEIRPVASKNRSASTMQHLPAGPWTQRQTPSRHGGRSHKIPRTAIVHTATAVSTIAIMCDKMERCATDRLAHATYPCGYSRQGAYSRSGVQTPCLLWTAPAPSYII